MPEVVVETATNVVPLWARLTTVDHKKIGILYLWTTFAFFLVCLLYTSPSPRDLSTSRMPSSA